MTELIISELLYLQNESQEKPVLMYINSPGTTTEDGQPTGFESEAFAIYDTMNYCKAPVHTVRRPFPPPCRWGLGLGSGLGLGIGLALALGLASLSAFSAARLHDG